MPTTEQYTESGTADVDNDKASGWETSPPGDDGLDSALVCGGTFRRHKWEGGNVCTRCGVERSAAAPTSAPDKPTRTRGVTKSGDFESLLAMLWAGLGLAVERQPWTMLGAPESERVAPAVGKTIRMESALAGKRLDKTIRRYPAVYRWINKQGTGIAADLVPLVVPPIVVGLAASSPEMAERMRPMLAMMLLPMLIEQAKIGEQQMELMEKLEGVNEQTLASAMAMLDSLLPTQEDDDSNAAPTE